MTTKMMLQMMDECYLEEVVKQRQGGKTVRVDIKDL
jgi:transposase